MTQTTKERGSAEIRKLRKSGASLAITIPSRICKTLNFNEGGNVEIKIERNKLVIKPVKEKMSVKDRIAMYQKRGLRISETLHDPNIE